jgi:predicted nucleic-acid-binding protein
MIGVDSNVLLRAIAADDPRQTPAAQDFLRRRSIEDPAVVNPIVLAELVWVLRGKYRMRRSEIVGLLDDVAASPAFHILQRTAFLRALQDYRDGIGQFTDALIGHLNGEAGCRATMTFDQGAPEEAGFQLLE